MSQDIKKQKLEDEQDSNDENDELEEEIEEDENIIELEKIQNDLEVCFDSISIYCY